MPNLDRHPPGTFNWFELATTDQAAAKEFYGHLFGWTAFDSPMGPGEFYTMFKLDDRDAAAGYTMRPEMLAQGIPPHWEIYISVESADETAAKVESFGGKLIAPPFDVMTYGRMAVVSDPTSGVFCIWQPKDNIGSTITGAPGTACWADLNTTDPEAAASFYAGVFGWELYTAPGDASGYRHIKSGGTGIGGMMQAYPQVPSHWLIYFLVADAEIATNQAGSLGATTRVPVTEIPNTGKFSIIQDPQGACFALFEAAPRQGLT
jgi:predicted enzyme related to lactoylglutathione lyase